MAKKRSKKRGRKPAARRGRPPGAASLLRVSTSILLKEVGRRERQANQLVGERDSLIARLDEINAELANFDVAPSAGAAPSSAPRRAGGRGGKRGPRPKNKTTLEGAMVSVIRTKVMGVSEIAAAVKKSGYKTNAANFRTMVNQTLIKSKKFKKIERGRYTTA